MGQHYVKYTEEFGRGLYAMHDLKSSRVLFHCELLPLSSEDTQKVNKTDLQYYTFKYDETSDCLCLGDGELFNHSDNPNVGYDLIDYDGRKVMMFFTLRDIEKDEQLLIDYNRDVQVDTTKYNVNLVK